MTEGTTPKVAPGFLPGASCPARWPCQHLAAVTSRYPSLYPGACPCLHFAPCGYTCVAHNCTCENPKCMACWGHGPALLAPASPGLAQSSPKTAQLRGLSVSGKLQGGINRRWPSTLPCDGAAREGFCPAGEADVAIGEGQDAEAVGWCIPVRGSLVWGVAGQD